jgi:hypothetical protein
LKFSRIPIGPPPVSCPSVADGAFCRRLIDAGLGPGLATRSGAEAGGREAVLRSNANAVQSLSVKK